MNATGNIQSTLTVESVMGIDVLSSSIEGLIGEPYSITTSSDFDEATVTFKINTENLEGDLDEYCVMWYDGENYYECQSSWYSSYATATSAMIAASIPSGKGIAMIVGPSACDLLLNGVELKEYYSRLYGNFL